jgi:hypothetical protein
MSRHVASRPALPVLTILALLLGLVASLALPAKVAAQTELIAELSGAEEVPGPGDDDGFGFASVTIHPQGGEVCAFISVIDIAAATAAHIHVGAAGVAGGVVVTLPTPDADGFAEDCVTGLDGPTLQAIIDDPAGYYVNVHNAGFPDGALRGQLTVPPPPPVELFADLTGAAEVPGPGDPDGGGFAAIAIFLDAGELCAFLQVSDIAAATAAHIHVGAAGVAGDIVVTLPTPDADGFAEGCVDGLGAPLLEAIAADPTAYYVNVHNAEFPGGAIRGQLSTEPPPPPACEPGDLCTGMLSPGTYTYTGFGTAVTFTTVTEWFALLDEIPSLSLFDDELFGGLFAFQFTGGVFADPCDFESGTTIGDSPSEVIAWLTDRSFLETSAAASVTYGGASGLQVDVTAVTLPPGCTDPPWVLLFTLPIVGDFHFEEGSVARVVALDVNGETILFIAESFPGGSPAEFLARAQGVLDSLVWSLETDGGGPLTPSPGNGGGSLPDTAMPAGAGSMSWLAGVGLLSAAAVLAARRRARR